MPRAHLDLARVQQQAALLPIEADVDRGGRVEQQLRAVGQLQSPSLAHGRAGIGQRARERTAVGPSVLDEQDGATARPNPGQCLQRAASRGDVGGLPQGGTRKRGCDAGLRGLQGRVHALQPLPGARMVGVRAMPGIEGGLVVGALHARGQLHEPLDGLRDHLRRERAAIVGR